MTTGTNERIVPGTIKEKAEVENRKGETEYKLSITSPWFDSPRNLPQVIYVPEGVGQQLKVGSTKNFLLRSQGLIKDDYDGSKPWMYRWRFAGMAGDGAQPDAPPSNGASRPQTARTTPTGPSQGTFEDALYDSLSPVPFYPNADKYSGANIAYEQWKTDNRTAVMQAVAMGGGKPVTQEQVEEHFHFLMRLMRAVEPPEAAGDTTPEPPQLA